MVARKLTRHRSGAAFFGHSSLFSGTTPAENHFCVILCVLRAKQPDCPSCRTPGVRLRRAPGRRCRPASARRSSPPSGLRPPWYRPTVGRRSRPTSRDLSSSCAPAQGLPPLLLRFPPHPQLNPHPLQQAVCPPAGSTRLSAARAVGGRIPAAPEDGVAWVASSLPAYPAATPGPGLAPAA